MMDANKMIMDIMSKKGIKDAELTSAEKMMTGGYNMITKGERLSVQAWEPDFFRNSKPPSVTLHNRS